ncbi:RAP domain-containing protein [Picochlorum sp. SENEW3]|nr:RAP domain-containing protein [Picochlorum sp. SENEW3]WPT14828.1 RAP domain-containing protein [Picochlorum sp. SENEW3]
MRDNIEHPAPSLDFLHISSNNNNDTDIMHSTYRPRHTHGFEKKPVTKNLARTFAIRINRDITHAKTAHDILNIVNRDLENFDGVNISTAIHRLASFDMAPMMLKEIRSSEEFHQLVSKIPSKSSSLAIRNIANVLWGFAKLEYRSENVLDFLCNCLLYHKISQGLPQNIANSLWAIALLRYSPNDRVMKAIEFEIQKKIADFTDQNIANCLLSFAKCEDYAPQEATMLCLKRELLKKIDGFSAQALSNSVWGLSKLGAHDATVFKELVDASMPLLPSYNAQNIALTLWGFANVDFNPGKDCLQQVCDVAQKKIREFSPQNLVRIFTFLDTCFHNLRPQGILQSNLVWSLSSFEAYHPVFDDVVQQAIELLPHLSAQSVSNILWSFAHLDKPISREFLSAIASNASIDYSDWTPQNLSNAVWSISVSVSMQGVKGQSDANQKLFDLLSNEICSRLKDPKTSSEFSCQNLSNYFWSLGTRLESPGLPALENLMTSALIKMQDFKPQEIANISWSCARLDYYNKAAMNLIAGSVVQKMDEYEGQNLSNVLWAFAKLRHSCTALYKAASTYIPKKLHTFSYQHFGNMLWGYASLGFKDSEMASSVKAEVLQRASSGDAPESFQLANILWALSVSDAMDRETWNFLMKQISSNLNVKQETLTQVFQSKLILEARSPEQPWTIPDSLEDIAEKAWKDITRKVRISEFHSHVSQTLLDMSEEHEMEYMTPDGCFSIDIAFPKEKIALEIDGPLHFTRAGEPLGDSLARDDMLRARGWYVASIPFYSWSSDDPDSNTKLLNGILTRARSAVNA